MLRPSEKGAVHNTFEAFNSIENYTGGAVMLASGHCVKDPLHFTSIYVAQ